MANRRLAIVLIASAGALAGTIAPMAVAQRVIRQPLEARQVDPRAVTMQRLMKPMTIELSETRLEDVIEFIRQATNADIEPLWADDRNDTGLDKDAEVTLSVRNMTALAVIERVLERVDEDDFDRATWQFDRDGVLQIGPRTRLNRFRTVIIYDVRDLLFDIPNFENAPTIDIDAVLQQAQQGGGGGGQSIFEQDDDDDLPEIDDEEQLEELMEIIEEFVETDQWGFGAHMRAYRGTLIINAPDYVHRKIGGYQWWEEPRISTVIARESGVKPPMSRKAFAEAEARKQQAADQQQAQDSKKASDSEKQSDSQSEKQADRSQRERKGRSSG